MNTTGPQHIVVMGVSGCGKSTIGRGLAEALGSPFVEGDALHPPANVQRMAAGIALTDDDRHGWLADLAALLADAHARGKPLVMTCSALKRSYRDQLRSGCPDLRFVHLHGSPALLAERLARRSGHYMPPSLLPSQLQTLEAPGADEAAVTIDIDAPSAQVIRSALQALRGATSPTP